VCAGGMGVRSWKEWEEGSIDRTRASPKALVDVGGGKGVVVSNGNVASCSRLGETSSVGTVDHTEGG